MTNDRDAHLDILRKLLHQRRRIVEVLEKPKASFGGAQTMADLRAFADQSVAALKWALDQLDPPKEPGVK